VGKKESSYMVSGNPNECSHCGKQHGVCSKTKIEIPYYPGIPLLSMYSKETELAYKRESCISILIVAFL
jgi:hypothetical protein